VLNAEHAELAEFNTRFDWWLAGQPSNRWSVFENVFQFFALEKLGDSTASRSDATRSTKIGR